MDAAAGPGRRGPAVRPRSLAFQADFRRLWTGDLLGQLGAQLAGLVLPVYAVQQLDAGAWQMGLLSAAETAAFLVVGLPAGAWVDRMRKRPVLVVADVVRAAVLAVVVTAASTGHASMPLLYVAALVMSCATVFFDVAHQSYVPGLVGLDRIVEGNAKLQATASVAQVTAPALGGALLRVMSAPALLAVTVLTYLASALAVRRIARTEVLPDRSARRPVALEIAEGLRFVVDQPLLRRIVACTSMGNLFGSISGALLVLYALRVLRLDEAALGVVLAAGAVGGLVGALLGDRVSRWVGEGRVIPVSALALGPGSALVPLAAPLQSVGVPAEIPLVVGGALSTFMVVVYNVAQVSFRQRLCPPALLGRMNASVRFLVWGTIPVGGVLAGWLGTSLGTVPALWIGSAGIGLAAIPVLASPLRTMRTLPGPPPTEPATAG